MDTGSEHEALPGVVALNVGGLHFTTSLETLRSDRFGGSGDSGDAGSMLASMFSGRLPTRRDAEGRFFIDRDGRHFHHILNYLRDGSFPARMEASQRLELEREASFYGLEALASNLRGDIRPRGLPALDGCADDGSRAMPAAEAANCVLNRALEDWPEFVQHVQSVLNRLLAVGGVGPDCELNGAAQAASDGRRPSLVSGVVFDEAAAASLPLDTLAVAQIELAHLDAHSNTWRWSDRKTGVNSVLRAKLLRCHLQRLGYSCQITPVIDKKEVSAYVLQVELRILA